MSIRQPVLFACFKTQTISRNPQHLTSLAIAQSSSGQTICIDNEPLAIELQYGLHSTVTPLRVFHHLCSAIKRTQLRLSKLAPRMCAQTHARKSEENHHCHQEDVPPTQCATDNQYSAYAQTQYKMICDAGRHSCAHQQHDCQRQHAVVAKLQQMPT